MTIISDDTGYTASAISVNGVDVTASNFQSAGGNDYSVDYTISEGDTPIADSAQIPISVALSDGTNVSAAFTTSPAFGDSPGIDADSPVFSSAETVSTVQIAITVDQTVSDNGAAFGDFTLGGVARFNRLNCLSLWYHHNTWRHRCNNL